MSEEFNELAIELANDVVNSMLKYVPYYDRSNMWECRYCSAEVNCNSDRPLKHDSDCMYLKALKLLDM